MANSRRKQGRHACALRFSRVPAHSARPRKMPGWKVPVRENFSVNKRVCRKQTVEIVLRGFCLFSFSNFTFGFHGFHLKKLKLIQLIFERVPGRKFSGEQ